MARINLEDSIYKDERFIQLVIKCGGLDAAIGKMVRAWSLAQSFWLTTVNDRLIPVSEWTKQKMSDDIIDVGLAEIREKGIYVKGSSAQFNWLIQRSEAGKKSKQRPSNGRSTTVNGSNPLSLSLIKENNNKRKVTKYTPQSSAQFVELLGREFLNNLLKIYPDKKHIEVELEKIILWANNKDRVVTRSDRGWRRTVSTWLAKSWKDRIPDHDKQKPMRYADV